VRDKSAGVGTDAGGTPVKRRQRQQIEISEQTVDFVAVAPARHKPNRRPPVRPSAWQFRHFCCCAALPLPLPSSSCSRRAKTCKLSRGGTSALSSAEITRLGVDEGIFLYRLRILARPRRISSQPTTSRAAKSQTASEKCVSHGAGRGYVHI